MVRDKTMCDTALYRDDKGNELGVGSIVSAVSGRDRKRVFAIVAIDPSNVKAPMVIANGTLRTLESRKHKNPMHLHLIGVPKCSDIQKLIENPDDKFVAELCNEFDSKMSKKI